MSSRKRGKTKTVWPFLVLLAVLAAGIGICAWRFLPSTRRVTQEEFYALPEGEAVLYLNGERAPQNALVRRGEYWIPADWAAESVWPHLYLDDGEGQVLCTLPEREYVFPYADVLLEEGGQRYLASSVLTACAQVDVKTFAGPDRVLLLSGEVRRTAAAAKDTQVRTRGGVKAPIFADAAKGEELILTQTTGDWAKVQTSTGIIGYVRRSALSEERETKAEYAAPAPDFSGPAQPDGPVVLAWHAANGPKTNAALEETMQSTKGVTAVSPTWFSLQGRDGGYASAAERSYVDKAHAMGLAVWIRLDNFDKENDTTAVLNTTALRKKLVRSVVDECIALGADGINLDFEAIPREAGEGFVQLVRELAVSCHRTGLTLSTDNYVPSASRAHYRPAEQGVYADYVVIMAYGEHWDGTGAGSNASLEFTARCLRAAAAAVPADKILHALPFYTQIWKETPCAADEAGARSDGNSVYPYYKLESSSASMKRAKSLLESHRVTPQWDEGLGQYYGEYEEDGSLYRIWLEDENSLRLKTDLIREAGIAGAACWRLGFEDPAVWPLLPEK